MTDFDDVRIRMTRMGSGTGRNTQRIRRHITKGFYDPVPEGGDGGTGNIVINEVTNWSSSVTSFWNIYSKTLTGNEVEAIDGPNFLGQALILNLNVAAGASWQCTGSFTEDETTYGAITFNDSGENCLLFGLEADSVLSWYVFANNGGALS